MVTSFGLEEGDESTLNNALFFGFFLMFGIGIPAAAGSPCSATGCGTWTSC